MKRVLLVMTAVIRVFFASIKSSFMSLVSFMFFQILRHLRFCHAFEPAWTVSNSFCHADAETPSHGYCAPTLRSAVGRPKFDITRRQLKYFLGMDFTAPEMAEMFGVSVRTIR